jgi:hypothetical protein
MDEIEVFHISSVFRDLLNMAVNVVQASTSEFEIMGLIAGLILRLTLELLNGVNPNENDAVVLSDRIFENLFD